MLMICGNMVIIVSFLDFIIQLMDNSSHLHLSSLIFRCSFICVAGDLLIYCSSAVIPVLLPVNLLQRAWLLKLLAVELHSADMTGSGHRETCLNILAHMFGQDRVAFGADLNFTYIYENHHENVGSGTMNKSKVSCLLLPESTLFALQ